MALLAQTGNLYPAGGSKLPAATLATSGVVYGPIMIDDDKVYQRDPNRPGSTLSENVTPIYPISFVHDYLPHHGLASSGKQLVDGSPAAPSLVIRAAYSFIVLRLPVLAGSRTLTVKTRQVKPATPRPKVVLRADGTVVATGQSVTAPSGVGWVTATINFTALVDGAVDVELWNTTFAADTETFFDSVGVR